MEQVTHGPLWIIGALCLHQPCISCIVGYLMPGYRSDINNVVTDEQNGFRSKRSYNDQLSCFTNIIECRKAAKKSTFVAFVDFSKAYDHVNHELLWDKLESLWVNGWMLLAIQSIYKDVKYCVRVNGLFPLDYIRAVCSHPCFSTYVRVVCSHPCFSTYI